MMIMIMRSFVLLQMEIQNFFCTFLKVLFRCVVLSCVFRT